MTNEDVTFEELGGASVHTSTSGVAHNAFDNDVDALLTLRALMNFLPVNNTEAVPIRPSDDPWWVAAAAEGRRGGGAGRQGV